MSCALSFPPVPTPKGVDPGDLFQQPPRTEARTPASTMFNTTAKSLTSRVPFRWSAGQVVIFEKWIRLKGANVMSADLVPLLRALDLDGYEDIENQQGDCVHDLIIEKVRRKLARTKGTVDLSSVPVKDSVPVTDSVPKEKALMEKWLEMGRRNEKEMRKLILSAVPPPAPITTTSPPPAIKRENTTPSLRSPNEMSILKPKTNQTNDKSGQHKMNIPPIPPSKAQPNLNPGPIGMPWAFSDDAYLDKGRFYPTCFIDPRTHVPRRPFRFESESRNGTKVPSYIPPIAPILFVPPIADGSLKSSAEVKVAEELAREHRPEPDYTPTQKPKPKQSVPVSTPPHTPQPASLDPASKLQDERLVSCMSKLQAMMNELSLEVGRLSGGTEAVALETAVYDAGVEVDHVETLMKEYIERDK